MGAPPSWVSPKPREVLLRAIREQEHLIGAPFGAPTADSGDGPSDVTPQHGWWVLDVFVACLAEARGFNGSEQRRFAKIGAGLAAQGVGAEEVQRSFRSLVDGVCRHLAGLSAVAPDMGVATALAEASRELVKLAFDASDLVLRGHAGDGVPFQEGRLRGEGLLDAVLGDADEHDARLAEWRTWAGSAGTAWLVLVLPPPDAPPAVLKAAAQDLRAAVPPAAVGRLLRERQPHAALLAPERDGTLALREPLAALARSHQVVVLAGRFPGPGPLRRAYRAALDERGRASGLLRQAALISFRDLWLRRVLAGGHIDDVRAVVREVLGPVLVLPPNRAVPLLETVEALHRVAGGIAALAQELHMHPKGVTYRLRRVEQLTGESWRETAAATRLSLAALLYRLRADELPPLGDPAWGAG